MTGFARRRGVVIGAVALVTALAVCTALWLSGSNSATHGPVVAAPDGPQFPVYPDVPAASSQSDLASLPLADTWAVIPTLLDQRAVSDLIDDSLWTVAQPTGQLTALYGEQSATAEPVAALGYFAVEDRTTTAVFAHQGGWLLIGTPARIALPSDRDGNAPTVSFAWARAGDFVLSEVNRRVLIDTSASTISLIDRQGTLLMHEPVKLGSPDAPTPTGTLGYIVATYTDAENQPWTGGEPIALVNSHSAALDNYGSDPAPTGIHYSTSETTNSKGCVRVSAAFARALDPLLGVRVYFS